MTHCHAIMNPLTQEGSLFATLAKNAYVSHDAAVKRYPVSHAVSIGLNRRPRGRTSG